MSIFVFCSLIDRKYMFKFVTNTTKESKSHIIQRLAGVGLEVKSSDIYSSLSITRDYLVRRSKKLTIHSVFVIWN